MKHYCLWIVFVLVLMACTTETPEKGGRESESAVFYGTTEPVGSKGTRVYADDKLRVLWDNDDRITIFNQYSLNREYRFTGNTGDNSGSFEILPLSDFSTGNEMDYVYAVYPYQSSTRIDYDGHIWFDLPSNQNYRSDTFGPGTNLMTAISVDHDLNFKNVCGYLTFKFFGESIIIQSISVEGNANEYLSGRTCITAALDSLPSISVDESQASHVLTLVCDPPVSIGSTPEEASLFWMVIPPVVFNQGITVTVETQRGTLQQKTTNPLTIQRNHRTSVSSLPIRITTTGLQNYEVGNWDWGD